MSTTSAWVCRRQVDRLRAVDGLPYDGHVIGGFQQHPKARPDELLVVGQEHMDGHGGIVG